MQKITLATLPDASAQEVFDQVARHLLAQGEPSEVKGTCSYRGHAGLMCAAGCLMSNEEYDRLGGSAALEGFTWSGLLDRGVVPDAHAGFIGVLQDLHDSRAVVEWPARLRQIAWKRDLSPAVLTQAPEVTA